MKKHHVLLTLIFAGCAAYLLKETFSLNERENLLAGELEMLRDTAIKKTTPSASGRVPPSRKQQLDVEKFMAEISTLLEAPADGDIRGNLMKFLSSQETLLASASSSKLKDLCASLKSRFPSDSAAFRPAARVMTGILGMVANSDPDWAIREFDGFATAAKAPMGEVLEVFGRWASQESGTMSPAYAAALKRWLDQAQAEGRVEEGSVPLAKLRADIAAAEGNVSAVIRELAGLPSASQRGAVSGYVEKLQTPAERRQALEELSSVLPFQNFQAFASTLAQTQGFESARELLATASLTPEKHDLAAASIASAGIGPETKERAAWLWENLKTEDSRALENFSENWSKGDHPAAATWLNTLPAGERRDAALKGFIPATAGIDGATAMDWALTISQPSLRSWMYEVAYSKWKETDPARADAYRKEKPLKAGELKPESADPRIQELRIKIKN